MDLFWERFRVPHNYFYFRVTLLLICLIKAVVMIPIIIYGHWGINEREISQFFMYRFLKTYINTMFLFDLFVCLI